MAMMGGDPPQDRAVAAQRLFDFLAGEKPPPRGAPDTRPPGHEPSLMSQLLGGPFQGPFANPATGRMTQEGDEMVALAQLARFLQGSRLARGRVPPFYFSEQPFPERP
jgi:hypothetical protein